MTSRFKRVCAIHDLSGFGRCALTTAIPVLSVMGFEVSPLPTSIFSAHCAFPNFSFLDCTKNMEKMIEHWEELELKFDCVYTGFLGSLEQIKIVEDFILKSTTTKEALIVVDPVMGDHGACYSTYTSLMLDSMIDLVRVADVVTPNLTEAAIILERPYPKGPITKELIMSWVEELSALGPKKVVLTSIPIEDSYFNLAYDRNSKEFFFMPIDFLEGSYPGTGDLFTSVLTGRLLKGDILKDAVLFTTKYLNRTVSFTVKEETAVIEGVLFEQTLGELL